MKHKFIRTACLGLTSLLVVAPLVLSSNSFNQNNHNTTIASSQNLQLSTLEDLNKADPAEVAKLSKFDSRQYGLVTSVKTQHKPKCYTFAAAAALEAGILKNPLLSQYTSSNLDISEENVDYVTKKRTADFDPLGLTSEDTLNRALYDGGYILNATNALMQWNGPVAQSTPMETLHNPLAITKNTFYMKYYSPFGEDAQTTISKVKEAVAQYGALAFSFAIKGNLGRYYNYNNNPNNFVGAHACAIVGWDDSISKTSYSPASEYDGGWIVKNSWGSGSNDKGYFYMSYDSMMSEVIGYEMAPKDTYQNNYYYDGSADTPYANNPTIYGRKPIGVIFPAKKASKTTKESIKAINVGINGDNVSATIEVYTGVEADLNDRTSSKNNPRSGTLKQTVKQTFKYAGLHTVDLPEPIELQPGENFSVVVTISGSDPESSIMLSREKSTNDLTYYLNGSNWKSTSSNIFGGEDEGNLVPRIKAFTNTEEITPEPTTISYVTNLTTTDNLTAGTSKTFTAQATTDVSGLTMNYDWYLDKGTGVSQRVQSGTNNSYTIKEADTSNLTDAATWKLYVQAYPVNNTSLTLKSNTCVISIAPKIPDKPVEPEKPDPTPPVTPNPPTTPSTPDPEEEIKKDITISNQPQTSQDVPTNKDGGLDLAIDAVSSQGKQLKYQWYEDKGTGVGWTKIEGATNKTYNVPSSELQAVKTASTWKYKAEIQYQDGSSTATYTSQTYQVNVKPTSTTLTPTPDNSTTKYSKFLSTPVIIGIAAGAVGTAALVGSAIYIVKKRKKHLK